MEVLRRCPLAIAQRLVHCAIALLTAVLDRVTKTMSVASLLTNNLDNFEIIYWRSAYIERKWPSQTGSRRYLLFSFNGQHDVWQPFPACHLTWRFPNYGSTHEHRPTLKPEYITQRLVHRWSPPPHTNHQGTVPSVFVVHVCMYRYTNIATIVLPYWSKIKSCKVCVCVCALQKRKEKHTK